MSTERTTMSTGPLSADMPPDPDEDDVPAGLAALAGQPVQITEPDGTTTTAVLMIVPGLFGHARRIREGFFDTHDDSKERQ